ncbi:MAG: hypothetical protein FWD47_06460 [Treponema sp.]|nr:hypothetical protein [Treponema sp.]
MKKLIIVSILCVTLPFAAAAQQITASSFEGLWVWDEKGDEDLIEFTELVFFGNVLLLYEAFYEYRIGYEFTYTRQVIEFSDCCDEFIWQYKFSNNTLVITDQDNNTFTYVRKNAVKSPLEGIWILIDGQFYNSDYIAHDLFLLFTGNLMAVSEDVDYDFVEYVVFEVAFNKSRFAIMDFFEEEISDEDLFDMGAEFNINGDILTLFDPDVRDDFMVFKRIY